MTKPILLPAFALMLLTFVVWLFMYVQRLRFLIANRISPRQVATPELINSVLPEHINRPSNNLKNLFELPVLFYVVCAVSLTLPGQDAMLLGLAWGYVLLRAVHSIIHCTTNIVPFRFAAYIASSVVLWIMLAKVAVTAVSPGS